MKNILVTGGAGFIGSHTCLVLLERGHNIFVIDSFVNSSLNSLEKVLEIRKNKNGELIGKLEIFNGDLTNKSFVRKVFLDIYKKVELIHGVIHFAGLKSISESILNPINYWEANVTGTINLLEIMENNQCNNLVFSSSASIYDQKENSTLNENACLNPISPYSNTKYTIEKILSDLYKSSKGSWRIVSLRYFNPIGAHPSGLIGEDPKGTPNNLFPLIVNTALGLQNKLKIYGNDWPTKDGTPIRDYIHVMDVAESHADILENLFYKDKCHFYLNIGTGIGTTVLELIKVFEKVNNVKVPYVFTERREGDSCCVIADNKLLVSKFNFKPRRNLEDMCRDGWKWKKSNPNGYV